MSSTREDGRPAILLYIQDWLSEESLKALGYAHRGLWIDMLCLMGRSPQKGFLLKPNGDPADGSWIASQRGGTTEEVERLIEDMRREAVFSTDDQGRIYNRRMRREMSVQERQSEGGKLGAKRRWLGMGADGLPMGSLDNDNVVSSKKKEVVVVLPDSLNCEPFLSAWNDWRAYRKEARLRWYTSLGLTRLFKRLAAHGAETAAAMIHQSIENNWQGIFDLKSGTARPASRDETVGKSLKEWAIRGNE